MLLLDQRRELAGGPDDYGLVKGEGFRVEATGGRRVVGEDVRRGPEADVRALLVVGGLLGSRHRVVPSTSVGVVRPRRKRVAVVEARAEARLVTAGRTSAFGE